MHDYLDRIEFYGLPGSGKTYLVEMITGVNRREIKRKATNKFLLAVKSLSRFSPVSMYYKYKVFKIIKEANRISKFHETSLNEMVDSIILVATAYTLNISNNSILDEGLVQRIISLSVNYGFNRKIIIQLLELFKRQLDKADIVFVNISVDSAFESIKLRNRKESRMDFFDDYKLMKYLLDYDEICHFIANYLNIKSISRNDFDEFIKEVKFK